MNAVTAVESTAARTTISQAAANALKAGDPVGGGFYAGQIRQADGLYILIVAPKDGGEHEDTVWNANTKRVDDARSFFDGEANTIAMGRAGSALGLWAVGLGINGFDDWYLPARDELELVYRNLKPTDQDNYVWRSGENPSSVPVGYPYTADSPAKTAAEAFLAGGPEAFDDESHYWTSTQSESYSYGAWFQGFGNGKPERRPQELRVSRSGRPQDEGSVIQSFGRTAALPLTHMEYSMTQVAEKAVMTTAVTMVMIPEVSLALASGEVYAGHLLGKDGEAGHHVILLPGDVSMPWKKAMEWASSVGGDLPTRKEQSLLFANRPEEFKREWYWSNTQSESYSYHAWSQDFGDGVQYDGRKYLEFRARAVRRVPA